jgi:hypothetical protein
VEHTGKGGIGELRSVKVYWMFHMQRAHVLYKIKPQWPHVAVSLYRKLDNNAKMRKERWYRNIKRNCHVSGVQQSAHGLAWREHLRCTTAGCWGGRNNRLAARGAIKMQRRNDQHRLVAARAPIHKACSSPHVVWPEVGTQCAGEQRRSKC